MEAITMETIKEKKVQIIVIVLALAGCTWALMQNTKPDPKPAPPLTIETLPAEQQKAAQQQIEVREREFKRKPSGSGD